VSLKVKGLRELAKSFDTAARAMGSAEARAVKRTGTTIIAKQSRAIVETVNLKVGTVKKELRTVQQPTAKQPRVVFEVKQRGVPLGEFIGTRQTKKGVSVQVLKGKPRQVLGAAFGAKSKGGAYFGRVAKGTKKYGSPHVGRLPIAKLYGPNVLSQYIKEAIQQAGVDTWEKRLPIELERETAFALKKAGLT
jgi:hypothetical protein